MNRGGWTLGRCCWAPWALWDAAGSRGHAGLPRRWRKRPAAHRCRVNGALSPVPQAVLDALVKPWLKQLGSGLASYFPLLLNWAGYAIWLLWGLGMLALMLLGALAHRYLGAAQR
ncbi:hypothetical protein M8494_28655 [Serratia ureilytica]